MKSKKEQKLQDAYIAAVHEACVACVEWLMEKNDGNVKPAEALGNIVFLVNNMLNDDRLFEKEK